MSINNLDRNFDFLVGLIGIVFLFLSIFVLIYLGIKKDLFSKRITYYVIAQSGENIERGIPVKLSGFKIGEVVELYLTQIDYIKIKIRVLERYKKWFRQDTQVILDQEGIIGNPYLKVIPGSKKSPVLPPKSTIKLAKVAGIKEIVADAQPVIADAKKIVANIRKMTDEFLDKNASMQKTIFNLEKVSANLVKITDKLLSEKGLIYYLTEDKRPVERVDRLLEHINNLIVTVDNTLQNATEVINGLGPLEEELKNTIQNATLFVRDLRFLKTKIDPILDDTKYITGEIKKASKDIYLLKIQTEYTLRLGSDLLASFYQVWPFKQKDQLFKEYAPPKP